LERKQIKPHISAMHARLGAPIGTGIAETRGAGKKWGAPHAHGRSRAHPAAMRSISNPTVSALNGSAFTQTRLGSLRSAFTRTPYPRSRLNLLRRDLGSRVN